MQASSNQLNTADGVARATEADGRHSGNSSEHMTPAGAPSRAGRPNR
jgi:hypothetical protein